MFICHCAIYRKHRLQLKHEISKQNTRIRLMLHHLLKNLVIFVSYLQNCQSFVIFNIISDLRLISRRIDYHVFATHNPYKVSLFA